MNKIKLMISIAAIMSLFTQNIQSMEGHDEGVLGHIEATLEEIDNALQTKPHDPAAIQAQLEKLENLREEYGSTAEFQWDPITTRFSELEQHAYALAAQKPQAQAPSLGKIPLKTLPKTPRHGVEKKEMVGTLDIEYHGTATIFFVTLGPTGNAIKYPVSATSMDLLNLAGESTISNLAGKKVEFEISSTEKRTYKGVSRPIAKIKSFVKQGGQ